MDKTISLEITGELHGRKVDYVLEKHLGLSTSLIRSLKRQEKGILLNGKRVKTIEPVAEGDFLLVNVPSKETAWITPTKLPLDILYEDDEIIVVNKPWGMPVHPSFDNKKASLLNAVMYYLGEAASPHIITRLDRDTSGVVLRAKNRVSAAFLTEEMKKRRIEKEYIAVVNGVFECTEGTISAPIKRKSENGILRCVSPDGKEAVTKYRVEKTNSIVSLVRLYPITGRTHQIRVHMSYLGFPIYGDYMYGAVQRGERTRLHCLSITFCHPENRKKIAIKSDIPDDIRVLII